MTKKCDLCKKKVDKQPAKVVLSTQVELIVCDECELLLNTITNEVEKLNESESL